MLSCDAKTGLCILPESADKSSSQTHETIAKPTVRYIGDPMCSWCWGISPTLKELASYCDSHNINFTVHVGGLRPGGGDEWNPQFKAFLRDEWETIHQRTGQPFGFSLLDKAEFNYDTEPACRAVVAMTLLLKNRPNSSQAVLAFFSGIQKQFYVDGADPKQPEFYRALCAEAGVIYEEFLKVFQSANAKTATIQEFERCRSWGVRGFPSILLEVNGQMTLLASGYTTGAALIENLQSALGNSLP